MLEDDVVLPADLGPLADALAEQLTEAEVALLNFDSAQPCRLTPARSVRLPSSRLLMLPIDINQPVSGAAYIITRKACERLAERLLPVSARVDDWAHRYNQEMLDRVRCVVPLAVTKSPLFGSIIERHRPRSFTPLALSLLTRYDPGFLPEFGLCPRTVRLAAVSRLRVGVDFIRIVRTDGGACGRSGRC